MLVLMGFWSALDTGQCAYRRHLQLSHAQSAVSRSRRYHASDRHDASLAASQRDVLSHNVLADGARASVQAESSHPRQAQTVTGLPGWSSLPTHAQHAACRWVMLPCPGFITASVQPAAARVRVLNHHVLSSARFSLSREPPEPPAVKIYRSG